MKRLFSSIPLTVAVMAGLLTALSATAQFSRPESAIKYRQSVMFLQGQTMGRLGAMLSGRVPFDAKAAAENAELIATFSRLPFSAFIDGTDKGTTRAKPEIWAEKDKFMAAATKYQEEATKLNAAAKTGNLDQIKVAFGAVDQACKGCHDSYQKPL
jgi:cytochrome c556